MNLDRYTVSDSGCWEWAAARNHDGYGITYGNGRAYMAHRAVYEHHRGPIPKGLELDHTCENPPCVNPDHLDAVTRPEHIARTNDRMGKNDLHRKVVELRIQGLTNQQIADRLGYSSRVSVYAALKYAVTKGLVDPHDLPRRRHLTDDDKAEMTAMWQSGMTQAEIARIYGLHSAHVSKIVRGISSHGKRRAS